MGLIEKEECAICSKPIIKLLNPKFNNGFYVCNDCLKSASVAYRTSNRFHSFTVEDIKKYLSQKKTEKEFLSTQFEKTKIFRTEAKGDIIYIDEKRGLWIDATDSHPDIIRIDQVIDCFVDTEISQQDYDPHYRTPFSNQIYDYIVFKLNHDYLSGIRLFLSNSAVPAFRKDSRVGNDIVEFFKSKLIV